jgi:hypothetical protein
MTAQPGVVADGPVCHGLCGAQPAPSRPAAKRYVGQYYISKHEARLEMHPYNVIEIKIRKMTQSALALISAIFGLFNPKLIEWITSVRL